MATIPGVTAKHVIIRGGCREAHGDHGAFEEAVHRLRAEYEAVMSGWPERSGVHFHLVLTIERLASKIERLAREEKKDGEAQSA